MSGIFIIALMGIIVFAAIRSNSTAIKLMCGFAWFIPIAYIVTVPPVGMEAGTPQQTIALVVMIGIGITMMFWAFKKQTQVTISSNYNDKTTSKTEEGSGWHLPDWMNNMKSESPNEVMQKKRMKLEGYRDMVHRAVYQPRRRR